MNEVLINALAARIKAGQMTLAQVPEVFRAEVETLVSAD